MAGGPRYHVPLRRRREGKTDYRRRLGLLKSRKPRVVVRKKLANVIVQVVAFKAEGDSILAHAEARELKKLGWEASLKNTPAAYLTGLLAGSRAARKGVVEGVLDIGRQAPTKGGKLFAAVKGVVDAGVKVPHGKEMLPPEERLMGSAEVAERTKTVKAKILGGA